MYSKCIIAHYPLMTPDRGFKNTSFVLWPSSRGLPSGVLIQGTRPCISLLQVSKSNENPTETSFRKGLSVFQKVTIQCDSFAITSTRVFWNITHWEHPFSPSQILGKTKTKESHELQSTISDILQGPYRKRFSLPNPFIQWICCFHCGKVNLSCS